MGCLRHARISSFCQQCSQTEFGCAFIRGNAFNRQYMVYITGMKLNDNYSAILRNSNNHARVTYLTGTSTWCDGFDVNSFTTICAAFLYCKAKSQSTLQHDHHHTTINMMSWWVIQFHSYHHSIQPTGVLHQLFMFSLNSINSQTCYKRLQTRYQPCDWRLPFYLT